VINWTYSSRHVRIDLPFGVAYGSDLHQVREVAVAAAATVQRVMPMPAPVCHATAFGQSSIDFVLRFWIEDAHNGVTNVKGEVGRRQRCFHGTPDRAAAPAI
jgi:small-conductance mechanosensitive channel